MKSGISIVKSTASKVIEGGKRLLSGFFQALCVTNRYIEIESVEFPPGFVYTKAEVD